ncbi:unnamed protein product [Hydatigera taeniaeformis]|uniref:NEDD8-activating enzyme E1 catalytic subunit n=1 Tax=Hydatigena taeniaeformis TaxID=6205 RepID=A0A0R3X277_HYDTA|nr:unnamed protein product [Hydatigera taeniaeformis]
MVSHGNVCCDRTARWEAIECILGRSGPLQRSEFEPSSEALMGFCHIDVVDMDTIDVSNLNRQFLFTEKDVGRSKAEVAADFIMRRIDTCKVTPHFKKIQDFGSNFYKQFDIVICGLDSVIARRWINSMLASLLEYKEDGTPDFQTMIPLVDGGTEGFKGHVIVVLFGFTGCIECSLDLYPPQVNYPLCTIAHTPRLPEHCVEFVRLLLWPKEQPFGPGVDIDGDSPDHLEWIFSHSSERAKEYGIQGVDMRLVKGVVKRIVPSVASTNAVIASALVTEAFKLVTLCYDYLNSCMNFSDVEGIYTYTFQIERKDGCLVCNNAPKKLEFPSKATLRELVEHLKNDPTLQMHSPTITTVLNGSNRTLFVDFDDAMQGLRANLSKSLGAFVAMLYGIEMHFPFILGLFTGSWSVTAPQSILVIFNSLNRLVLPTFGRCFASQHRANFKHQLKYVNLTDEPFAVALSPEAAEHAPASLPPPLDPAPRGSIPWFTLDPTTTLLIDARSPCEYDADHIEGAINVPILSNQERMDVGKIFFAGDALEARLLGARFACTNIAQSLRPEGPLGRLFEISNRKSFSPQLILVYCSRGGQRSMGLGTVLSELNYPGCEVACLAGGYRAWRRLLLRQLGIWPTLVGPGGLAGTLWVLSSLTGCGKTLLLEELEAAGESTLNLERMAEHKGSMFGGAAMQPTQRIFDARLHSGLRRCLTAPHVWTECESRSVGPRCQLGDGFWQRLRGTRSTARVWLSAPLEARVNWILQDYADWLHNSEENLKRVFESLANYHSKNRLESWRKLARNGDYAAFVAELLEHHYDPLYKKSRGPMLRHFTDMGLLHRVEVPVVSRAYFQKQTLKATLFPSRRIFGLLFVLPINEFPFFRCNRAFRTSCGLQRHPGITYPHKLSWQWLIEKFVNPNQYTVDPIRKIRTGGRGPDGRIQYKHVTTGLNMPYFLVDYVRSRQMEAKEVQEEVILKIAKNWWRDPYLALTASGEVKRWIIATSNMKEGDVIRSHWEIPSIPVVPVLGDAYPVGALPVGTQVCLIEMHPGEGAMICRAAGTSATVVRRGTAVHDLSGLRTQMDDMLSAEPIDERFTSTLQLDSSRREVRLLPTCVVVVGQVSNETHNKQRYRKFGEKYWHGIKQRSGLYQKKTGRFGRKIYPVDPLLDCTREEVPDGEIRAKFTLPERPELERRRVREIFADSLLVRRPKIRPVPGPNNALPHTLPLFTWRHY